MTLTLGQLCCKSWSHPNETIKISICLVILEFANNYFVILTTGITVIKIFNKITVSFAKAKWVHFNDDGHPCLSSFIKVQKKHIREKRANSSMIFLIRGCNSWLLEPTWYLGKVRIYDYRGHYLYNERTQLPTLFPPHGNSYFLQNRTHTSSVSFIPSHISHQQNVCQQEGAESCTAQLERLGLTAFSK